MLFSVWKLSSKLVARIQFWFGFTHRTAGFLLNGLTTKITKVTKAFVEQFDRPPQRPRLCL
jgi:hypothetical protein